MNSNGDTIHQRLCYSSEHIVIIDMFNTEYSRSLARQKDLYVLDRLYTETIWTWLKGYQYLVAAARMVNKTFGIYITFHIECRQLLSKSSTCRLTLFSNSFITSVMYARDRKTPVTEILVDAKAHCRELCELWLTLSSAERNYPQGTQDRINQLFVFYGSQQCICSLLELFEHRSYQTAHASPQVESGLSVYRRFLNIQS